MDNGEIKAAVAEIMKLRPTPKKAEAAKVEHRRTRQQLARVTGIKGYLT